MPHLQHHLQPNERTARKQNLAPKITRTCSRGILSTANSDISGSEEGVPRLGDVRGEGGGPVRTYPDYEGQGQGSASEEENGGW